MVGRASSRAVFCGVAGFVWISLVVGRAYSRAAGGRQSHKAFRLARTLAPPCLPYRARPTVLVSAREPDPGSVVWQTRWGERPREPSSYDPQWQRQATLC